MALEIVWSKEAEKQLDDVIEYLESNWTDKEISNFFQKLESAIQEIRSAPHRNKKSERKSDTHEYQLAPQITIFYNFEEKQIAVLLLWSNRQNPDKLK